MAVKYEKAASCQTVEATSALTSHTHLGADVGVSHAITELEDCGTPQRVLQWDARRRKIARATPLPKLRFAASAILLFTHESASRMGEKDVKKSLKKHIVEKSGDHIRFSVIYTHLGADVRISLATAELKDRGACIPQRVLQ